MATIEVEQVTEPGTTEAERVVRWREQTLIAVGYEPPLALELAACRHVDLHQAVALVRRGCPPEIAAQILL